MDDLRERLRLLETRVKRDMEHLLNVIGTQRERTDNAFDEAKLSLEDHKTRTGKAFDEVKLALREQEVALRSHAHSTAASLGELREILENLSTTVVKQEQLAGVLRRIERLEQGRYRPP